MKSILIVGGAGYIGSHMVKALSSAGYHTVTLDNLSTGFADAALHGDVVFGSLGNRGLLDRIFSRHRFDAVMHFAAYSQVAESIKDPAKYYRNNVTETQTLINAMISHRICKLVFSSTAAVYGNPCYLPLDESHPRDPINPYGRTKWIIEQMLHDYNHAYDLRAISLRYFNAAGADPGGLLGERHEPETHLIPLVLQAGLGIRDSITLYGDDYETPDGTCIRDYIHVEDLCRAHLLALQTLLEGAPSTAYNLGYGTGFSVLEVIKTAERVLQRRIRVVKGKRRVGDPAILVANAERVRHELGWEPRYADLRTIIRHAADWMIKLHRSPQPDNSPIMLPEQSACPMS